MGSSPAGSKSACIGIRLETGEFEGSFLHNALSEQGSRFHHNNILEL